MNQINLKEIIKTLVEAEKKLKNLENSNSSIILFGNSGQGKSTFFNFANQLPLEISLIGGRFHLINKDNIGAKVGTDVTSQTRTPEWTPFYDGFENNKIANFVDLPGLIDNDLKAEIVNSACIKHVFKMSSEVKILFVVDFGKIDDKGDLFCKEVLKPLVQTFPNFMQIQNSFILVISKADNTFLNAESVAERFKDFEKKLSIFSNEEKTILKLFQNPNKIILFKKPNYDNIDASDNNRKMQMG